MRATPISTSRRHTHRPGPTPTAAFAFVWLGALGAPPTPAVAQLAGTCFDVVEMGLWYPVEPTLAREDLRGPPPAEDSYNKAFPVRIRIEDDTMATGEWSRFEIPEMAQQTPHSIRAWRFSGDTLRLHLSDGFHGVRAHLLQDADGWAGTLRTHTDNGGTLLYERELVLGPVSCDSPPPISADEDPALLRTLELVGGESLELGEPLPDGVLTEPRSSRWLTALAEPAGPFAGGDTVLVEVGWRSGRVANIEVRFPPDFDVSNLVATLEEAFGPGAEAIGTAWRNRTTRVWVSPGGALPRARLTDPRFVWER